MAAPLLDFEGTAEETQGRLAGFAGQRLHVIVMPADNEKERYPGNAQIRNGVPLFPVDGRTDVVTEELIKRLVDGPL